MIMNNNGHNHTSNSNIHSERTYKLEVRQQPNRARMSGFGIRDRRPLDPPPIIQLLCFENGHLVHPQFEEILPMVLHCSLWTQDNVQECQSIIQPFANNTRTQDSVSSETTSIEENSTQNINQTNSITNGSSNVHNSNTMTTNDSNYNNNHNNITTTNNKMTTSATTNKNSNGTSDNSPDGDSEETDGTAKIKPTVSNVNILVQGRNDTPISSVSSTSLTGQSTLMSDYLINRSNSNSNSKTNNRTTYSHGSNNSHNHSPFSSTNHHVTNGQTNGSQLSGNGAEPNSSSQDSSMTEDTTCMMSMMANNNENIDAKNTNINKSTPLVMDVGYTFQYTQVILGSLVSPVHSLLNMHNERGYYFIFSDVSIRSSGQYRLRFNLFNIHDVVTTPIGIQRSLATVISEIFTVYSPKTFPGMTESTELSKCFVRQGVRIHIRSESQQSRTRNYDANQTF